MFIVQPPLVKHCHLSSLHAIPIWPLSSFHVAWQDFALLLNYMGVGDGFSWISAIFTDFGEINSTKSSVCSVTSRCPPDYSVTDKTAPHNFLFWPRDRVNHGGDLWGWPCWSSGFGSNILVMALFRVQGWHSLDGCPVLHLMVSLECPYFLVVLGNISKLFWLHLVFDESLSTLAIDQNRQSFSPRQQYSVTLCASSNPLQTAQYF